MRMRKKKGPWAKYVELILKQQFDGNQSELARAVGVTPQTVSRWIGTDSVPRHPVLVKVAAVTGRPVSELISVAYGVDPEDAKLQAEVQALSERVPVTQLDRILDEIEEAKKARHITAADYRHMQEVIAMTADVLYQKALASKAAKAKANDDLRDGAAALP